MYLLDTNVVSALSPARGAAREPLVGWLRSNTNTLHLSVVTIAELNAGVAKLRREKATRRADLIATWIDATLTLFADRVLGFGIDEARAAGELHDQARAAGLDPGFADIAIAATAKTHELAILTRNVRHFSAFGVPIFDPFGALPPDDASDNQQR